nr:MAG TPA: hypothetical protein [Caudoviricetes sp.]
MSATLATRPPKRFHPAGFHAFPFLPRFVGCFYMRDSETAPLRAAQL